MKIAILGNGNVGRRLGALFTTAGHEVVFAVRGAIGAVAVGGPSQATPGDAAAAAELLVLALPFLACEEALPPLRAALQGKIVVDATNPLQADWSPLPLGADTSGAERIAALVPGARVVKAFNTIFADVMTREGLVRGGGRVTAFLCGDDDDARARVAALAEQAGCAPVDAGPLRCARYLEAMAHLNIQLAVGMGGGTGAAFLYDRGVSTAA